MSWPPSLLSCDATRVDPPLVEILFRLLAALRAEHATRVDHPPRRSNALQLPPLRLDQTPQPLRGATDGRCVPFAVHSAGCTASRRSWRLESWAPIYTRMGATGNACGEEACYFVRVNGGTPRRSEQDEPPLLARVRSRRAQKMCQSPRSSDTLLARGGGRRRRCPPGSRVGPLATVSVRRGEEGSGRGSAGPPRSRSSMCLTKGGGPALRRAAPHF